MKITLGLLLSMCFTSIAYSQQTATLKAKFVYEGTPPKREKVQNLNRDPFCANLDIVADNMLVGENGEIQNMAVVLYERGTKVDIPAEMLKVPPKVIQLDNNGCMFEPHVLFVRPGQTINVTNSDQTGHNANFGFFNNPGVNPLIPVGGEKAIDIKEDEPGAVEVTCNIHPWMKAYLFIQKHPYCGISDETGEVTIENLPVGKVTFRVWHENAERSIDEGTVNGKKESWRRGQMEVDLKPGVNDLGTIKIAADKFKS